MKKMSIKVKVFLCLSVLMCIMGVTIFKLKSNYTQYVNSAVQNTHTYNVMASLNGITASLVDMETGQRGYALTGGQSFLEPFYHGYDQYQRYFDTAMELTAESPEQQQRLAEVKDTIDGYKAVLEESINMRKKNNPATVLEKVSEYEKDKAGKEYMDKIRSLISECINAETLILQEGTEEQARCDQRVIEGIRTGIIFALICFVLFILLFNLTIIKRIEQVSKAAESLAEGNLDVNLKAKTRDEVGVLIRSFMKMRNVLNSMIEDVNHMAQEAVGGNLSARIDLEKYHGQFEELVEGVNSTIEETLKPIQEAITVLSEIGNGNLSVEVTGDYQGDHAKIKDSVNLTSYELQKALSKISEASVSVDNNAKMLLNATSNMSVSISEQASAMEELSSSVEEIANKTKENVGNANHVNDIAKDTAKKVMTGEEEMDQMVLAMNAISESAKGIEKIIDMIQEIAEQTNLLSLNASIEAARAGEAGRGFAVVAEEVRELAGRSAQAALESRDLVKQSLDNVQTGKGLVESTAASLKEIANGANETDRLISNIAEFCNQQSATIGEINVALEEIAQGIQENAALSQETTASSEVMKDQADILAEAVSVYKF